MHDEIQYDESGRFVTDCFFEIRVPFPSDLGLGEEQRFKRISPASCTNDEALYCEAVGGRESIRCGKHSNSGPRTKLLVDLYGGPCVDAFVCEKYMCDLVARRSTAELLRAQSYHGLEVRELGVQVNQSVCPSPDIVHLVPLGREFVRRPVWPSEARCPHCGVGWLVCPKCKAHLYECESCAQRMVVPAREHKGPGDIRWAIQRMPDAGPIVEARDWDGSDFMQWNTGIVTRRVVRFLEKHSLGPILAAPLRTNVEGLSEGEIEALRLAVSV